MEENDKNVLFSIRKIVSLIKKQFCQTSVGLKWRCERTIWGKIHHSVLILNERRMSWLIVDFLFIYSMVNLSYVKAKSASYFHLVLNILLQIEWRPSFLSATAVTKTFFWFVQLNF